MQSNFQVNLSGIISLLSEHMYSSPKVYIRELLQNAVDAITAGGKTNEGKIDIELFVNNENSVLMLGDNGIGLSYDDILQFLSVIGESSKRGAVESVRDDFIGRFGIGLLSCFVVSDEIVVITKKSGEKTGYKWIGKNNGTYSILEVEDITHTGTTVYLKSNLSSKQYFDLKYVKDALAYYGLFLPYNISFTHNGESVCINDINSPWSPHLNKYDMLSLGESIFNEEFLDCIQVNSKNIKGCIYVISHQVYINSKSRGKIYSKGMFVTENSEIFMPEWGFFLRPLLNCNNLRLTASREDFFENEELEEAKELISDIIKSYIRDMAKYDEDNLKKLIGVHYDSLKQIATLDDELYPLVIKFIPFETTLGKFSLNEIVEKEGYINYAINLEEFKQMQNIAKAQNICIINGGYVFNRELINRFNLVMPDVEINIAKPNELVAEFKEIGIEESNLSFKFLDTAREILKHKNCNVTMKKFAPAETATFYAINDEAKLFQNLFGLSNGQNLFAEIAGLVLENMEKVESLLCFNYNNNLVKELITCTDYQVKKNAIEILYVQALLSEGHPVSKEDAKLLDTGLNFIIKKAINKE